MKCYISSRRRAFTLIETVIAIGVLAVLLTGFMMVFAPAAAGIRSSLSLHEADRLSSTLEQEMVTLRNPASASLKTGFDKAFEWILKSNKAKDAMLVYQYRGKLTSVRPDGTPVPEPIIKNKLPGKDYVVKTMARLKSDPKFTEDLTAIEGGIYLVKATQLVFGQDQLKLGTPGTIVDTTGAGSTTSDAYPEAVIPFSADFFFLPTRSASYFASGGSFEKNFARVKKPVFTRNLAVRR